MVKIIYHTERSTAALSRTRQVCNLYQMSISINGGEKKPPLKCFMNLKTCNFNFSYLSIMINLCRVEIAVSLGFLIHGFTCPGFAQESAYQGTCHMNVVAAVVGATTGCIGLGVVHR